MMGWVKPHYPEKVWDGSSLNPERLGIASDRDPNSQDWDQMVAEVRAIQARLTAMDLEKVLSHSQLTVLTPVTG